MASDRKGVARWTKVACPASPKLGLAFLMVPKVITTSCAKLLLQAEGVKVDNSPNRIHALRKRFDVNSKEAQNDYFVCSFVRNPFDRLYACWKNKVRDNNLRLRSLCGRVSFERFVRFLEVQGTYVDGHTARQVDFVHQGRIEPYADYVGRYENLSEDWSFIRALFPDLPELPKLNASPTSDYRKAYTADLVDRVSKLYEEDLDAFGYSFEG